MQTVDAPHSTPDARPLARAVFLDRDGTLIRDRHYGFDPDQIELLEGVVEGLRILQAADYRLVVITNQSGVARGYFGEADVRAMHRRLDAILGARGIRIDAYYYCPHHPEGVVAAYARACACRKPQPGLIHRASADLGLDLRRSWVVGDAPSDVLAGRAAGCQTALLTTRGESQRDAVPTCAADSLLEAARIIVSADEAEPLTGRSA